MSGARAALVIAGLVALAGPGAAVLPDTWSRCDGAAAFVCDDMSDDTTWGVGIPHLLPSPPLAAASIVHGVTPEGHVFSYLEQTATSSAPTALATRDPIVLTAARTTIGVSFSYRATEIDTSITALRDSVTFDLLLKGTPVWSQEEILACKGDGCACPPPQQPAGVHLVADWHRPCRDDGLAIVFTVPAGHQLDRGAPSDPRGWLPLAGGGRCLGGTCLPCFDIGGGPAPGSDDPVDMCSGLLLLEAPSGAPFDTIVVTSRTSLAAAGDASYTRATDDLRVAVHDQCSDAPCFDELCGNEQQNLGEDGANCPSDFPCGPNEVQMEIPEGSGNWQCQNPQDGAASRPRPVRAPS